MKVNEKFRAWTMAFKVVLIYTSLVICFQVRSFAQLSEKARFNTISRKDGVFKNDLSWDKVLQEAKKENRYIFVDCFATWCGPCKRMDSTVFTSVNVRDFMSKAFCSVKIQFDSTKSDDLRTREFYTTARSLEQQYNVLAFPTYLIFNSDGILVERIEGAILDSFAFLARVTESLDPKKQYYSVLRSYNKDISDQAVLSYLIRESILRKDRDIISQLGNDWVSRNIYKMDRNTFDTANLLMRSSKSVSFLFFGRNATKVDSIMANARFAESALLRISKFELFRDFIYQKETINWEEVSRQAVILSPLVAKEVVLLLRVQNAEIKGDYKSYATNLLEYFDLYPESQNKQLMNNQLWPVFENCDDKKLLRRAASWSKKTVDFAENGGNISSNIDTYANFLYKIGKRNKAIKWERQGLKLARSNGDIRNINSLSETLEKMQKGIKTWR